MRSRSRTSRRDAARTDMERRQHSWAEHRAWYTAQAALARSGTMMTNACSSGLIRWAARAAAGDCRAAFVSRLRDAGGSGCATLRDSPDNTMGGTMLGRTAGPDGAPASTARADGGWLRDADRSRGGIHDRALRQPLRPRQHRQQPGRRPAVLHGSRQGQPAQPHGTAGVGRPAPSQQQQRQGGNNEQAKHHDRGVPAEHRTPCTSPAPQVKASPDFAQLRRVRIQGCTPFAGWYGLRRRRDGRAA